MHIKRFVATSVVVASSWLSLGAQAAEFNWDAHDTVEVGIGLTPAGNINDTYSFSISDPSVLHASAVANNLNATFGVEDGLVSLMRWVGDGQNAQLVGSFSFDGSSGDIAHAFGSLTPGDYFYQITGLATGYAGGVYSLTSEVAAVPEPATGALVTAAAGLLFLLMRRRDRG